MEYVGQQAISKYLVQQRVTSSQIHPDLVDILVELAVLMTQLKNGVTSLNAVCRQFTKMSILLDYPLRSP